jgi:hypothetical protein
MTVMAKTLEARLFLTDAATLVPFTCLVGLFLEGSDMVPVYTMHDHFL